MSELIQPKCKQVEKYTEEDYKKFINDCYEEIEIGGLTFDPADIIKELDPTAFNCGFSDYQEYEDIYICPVCDIEHEDEEEALYCCQEESEEEEYCCSCCGEEYDNKEDSENCCMNEE